ncbi:MAG TPA: hypothetical protein PKE29_08845 [Phycisphaerales bacterium]|nr:hypothetical protein [Phycisphaerales bacterium]
MSRRLRTLGAAAAMGACAGAQAQGPASVEMRIVPRLGHAPVVAGYEAVYDLAVQARVSSAGNLYGLSAFGFAIRVAGEAESAGTLWRAGISLTDGTYDPGLSVGNWVGRAGVAAQFSYLAYVSPYFNGVINGSVGGFVNTPDQEIGLIVGSASGGFLVSCPGVDQDFDGLPDANPLSPEVMGPYFGAGEFVDIYRFRYALRLNTGRTLSFVIEGVSGVQAFDGRIRNVNGLWGPDGTADIGGGDLVVTELEIRALPSPGAIVWVGAAAALCVRRRRAGP